MLFVELQDNRKTLINLTNVAWVQLGGPVRLDIGYIGGRAPLSVEYQDRDILDVDLGKIRES